MPTNEFLEFATSSAAYVETQLAYSTDPERVAGQQSGIARAEINNKALRQANGMAAAIGAFMVTQGYDALDDGDTATRASDFALAVAALIAPNITSAVNAAKTDVLKKVFPVGSLYTSTSVSTNPSSLLGFGTWARIQGRVILGASSAYPAGSTGGSATHTLTTAEMPSHSHTASSASAGSHTHTASTASAGAHTHSVTATAASAGAHIHTATNASNGAHTHSVTATAASAGAHTHNVTVDSAGAHTHTASTGSAGTHNHTATAANAGAHTHTRGTMNITGSLMGETTPSTYPITGAFYESGPNDKRGIGSSDNNNGTTMFDASRSWTGATSSAGGHTHTLSVANAGAHTHSVTVTSAGAHTHSASTASAGSHTHSVSGTAASAGTHTHTITVASAGDHTHSVSGTAASAGAHTHGVTVNSAGAHTHTITVNATGGGTVFSVMDPYFSAYIWQRTA